VYKEQAMHFPRLTRESRMNQLHTLFFLKRRAKRDIDLKSKVIGSLSFDLTY